jgi:hypothetical protein
MVSTVVEMIAIPIAIDKCFTLRGRCGDEAGPPAGRKKGVTFP